MPTHGDGTVATAPPRTSRRGGAFFNEDMTVDKDKLLDELVGLIDAIDKMGAPGPTDAGKNDKEEK